MGFSLLLFACAALAGLLAGSFLNVCILRLPHNQSIIKPRSHCPNCGHTIRWFDNIPLQSFLLLLGRCRDCGIRISWQYPLVELGTALWFALAAAPPARLLVAGNADPDVLLRSLVHSAALAALGFLLIGLAFMDWQTGLLPNEFTLGGLGLGLFLTATESFFLPAIRTKTFFTPEEVLIGQHCGAALLGFLLLWLIGALYAIIRKRPGMGRGDAKMLAMIGAFLGLGPTLLAFVTGVGLAALTGVALLAARRADGKTQLPFGTFLAAGGLFSALCGPPILVWYQGLFR